MQKPQDTNWNPPRPRTPAPAIDPVFLWPTPDKRDYIFYVEKNGDLPINQTWDYGSPYPDRLKYPDHQLVLVTPQTPDKWSKWYYASNRLDQDEYNWTFTDADIGGTKFAAVDRLYVTPRADFDPASPAQGTAMADVPRDKFSGTYVLAARAEIQIDDETLRSLYVFEKRTYVKKVTLIDNKYSEELEANLSVTATLRYRGETISGTPIEDLVADEGNSYWGLNATTAREAQQLTANWFLVTERKLSVRRDANGDLSDAWTLKQLKEKGTDADVPARYADQVTATETVTKEDLPAANVDNIPAPDDPIGDVVRNRHKKISDLHYEKAVLERTFNLDPSLMDIEVDVRPYVKITTRAVGGLTSVLPPTGSGSSQLIWKAGQKKLYENKDIDSEARPGLKSIEEKDQQWGSYTERTDYDTSYDAPPGGSSQLVYDDGETKVYEISQITEVTADGTTRDKDPQPWGFVQWDGQFAVTEDTSADRTRQVWRKGPYKVYLNETVSTDVSGTTHDKDPQPWGTLNWNGAYSTTEDTNAERSRQVWRIGDNKVFLNETLSVEVEGTTLDKDPQQWGYSQWDGTYATTSSGDRSRQVWRMGNNKVYLNENVTLFISGGSLDVEPQPWGSLRWEGTFANSSSGERSRKVTSIAGNDVYLNENAVLQIMGDSFVSELETSPLYISTETSTFSTTPSSPGPTSRSRLVFAKGAERVFENIDITTESNGTREYGTVVPFSTPSVVVGIEAIGFPLRNGDTETYYMPQIEEGVEGYFPATVVEYFTKTPAGPTEPIITFKPRPISFITPFGSLRVPPTLHGDLSFGYSTGTKSRKYQYAVGTVNIPATNYTDWRGAGRVLVAFRSDPFKDGFIQREVYVTL